MTIFFDPDITAPHDPAGWGRWLLGHYLEHRAMNTAAQALTPPAFPRDFALQSWSDEPAAVVTWMNVHQQVHEALRQQAGFTGIDLSEVDVKDGEQFLEWMDDHRNEHASLRAFYKIS